MLAAVAGRPLLVLVQMVALAELVAAEQAETVILLERQGLQIRAAAAVAAVMITHPQPAQAELAALAL